MCIDVSQTKKIRKVESKKKFNSKGGNNTHRKVGHRPTAAIHKIRAMSCTIIARASRSILRHCSKKKIIELWYSNDSLLIGTPESLKYRTDWTHKALHEYRRSTVSLKEGPKSGIRENWNHNTIEDRTYYQTMGHGPTAVIRKFRNMSYGQGVK